MTNRKVLENILLDLSESLDARLDKIMDKSEGFYRHTGTVKNFKDSSLEICNFMNSGMAASLYFLPIDNNLKTKFWENFHEEADEIIYGNHVALSFHFSQEESDGNTKYLLQCAVNANWDCFPAFSDKIIWENRYDPEELHNLSGDNILQDIWKQKIKLTANVALEKFQARSKEELREILNDPANHGLFHHIAEMTDGDDVLDQALNFLPCEEEGPKCQ